jgi:hypothetical protein
VGQERLGADAGFAARGAEGDRAVHCAGEGLERSGGVAADGDGVAEELQDGLALGEGPGVPEGFGVEAGEGDQAERDGIGCGCAAEVLDWDGALGEASGAAHLEGLGEGMDEAFGVDEGELVGVVGCALADELGDQGGLAGERASGKQEGSALHGDDSGVDEEEVGGVLGGAEDEVGAETVEERLGRLATEDSAGAMTEAIGEISAGGEEGEGFLRGRGRDDYGSKGEMVSDLVEEFWGSGADLQGDSVGLDAQAMGMAGGGHDRV